MRFILLSFCFLVPMASFAHNMPDDAKKEALIEVMIKHNKPFYGIVESELVNGEFKTSFAETHLVPMFNVLEWGYTGYEEIGDQDLEEFHFTFKHDGIDFTLNCLLESEEILKGTSIKYTLDPRYCTLSSKGTSQTVSIPSTSVNREEPY